MTVEGTSSPFQVSKSDITAFMAIFKFVQVLFRVALLLLPVNVRQRRSPCTVNSDDKLALSAQWDT